ncbi:Zinc finger CW-type PWWP domain protein 2 [Tupaia chinensis]|uniref:Zinc finger CW-type PWWP domain protein 2 n=1 Tax=Tupaia chinensis TaxID=246437 RepID=L9KJ66_TUPCH|nr:Zinc finger CW-type PWWP domain protein 2 [Tupaia chinensis]
MDKEKLDDKITESCESTMDSSVGNNIYVNKMWVQCENESCLKWRLLSSEDAAKVDHNEPWYCFMNTDSRYNKCSISEEDFPEESQLYQSGFKIVYSQLPLGSLVLVKLQNWPRKGNLKCSLENVCSDDALSKENMVVSETEVLLKELEQMLQQALEPTATPDESEEDRGEEINRGEKLSKCSPEASADGPFENYYEEDYLIIDGIKLKAGECIENITNKFKEIDALMSEF